MSALDLDKLRSCALGALGSDDHLHPTLCSCEYCCFATVFDPETCLGLLDRVAELDHRVGSVRYWLDGYRAGSTSAGQLVLGLDAALEPGPDDDGPNDQDFEP